MSPGLPGATEVVVAGAGIVGLGLAWSLVRAGRQVLLLEAGRVGGSTSAGTFAWVNASSKTGDAAYHRLNADGLAAYEALASETGAVTIGLCGAGSLQWTSAGQEALAGQLRGDFEALRGFGYPVAWLEAAALRARLPALALPEDAVGLLAPADRWLEVPRLLDWLLADFLARGGRLATGTPLGGVVRGADGGLAAVETPTGRVACAQLVIAAGAQSAALLERITEGGLPADRFPLRQVPGFLLETAPTPLGRALELVLWAPDAAGFHLRPTAAGGLLLGADDLDAEVGEGDDPATIARAREELLRRAKAWLPALPLAEVAAAATWRIGRRAMPRDGHSILGPLAALPGLFVAVTHSGVTLALRGGALLTAELAGAAPPALDPFRPARFGL